LFFDSGAYVRAGEPGLPDGLKVHSTGVIFATGPGGVFIFNPDGKLLGRIRLSLAAANCALDEKRGFLYVTATNVLLRIKLAV
jgi:gluconolactonase